MAESWRIGCPSWVMSAPLHAGARVLLMALWRYADNDEARAYADGRGPAPFVFASRETLARDTGASPRTIDRQMAALHQAGYLRPDVRVLGGKRIQGRTLTRPTGEPDPTPATVQGPSPMTGLDPTRMADPSSVTPGTRHRRRERPVTGDQSDPSPATGQSLHDHAKDHSKDHARGGELALATHAAPIAPAPKPTPEPLRLDLVEPDALDPDRLTARVIDAATLARRELGATARRTPVTDDERRIVLGLRSSAGDLVDLPDGPADLRTEDGLTRAWRRVIARKAEDLRRRAERRGERLADLAIWLRLPSLAKDARQLLADGDDLDDRRPASARASPGPRHEAPQNGLDLARLPDLAHLPGDDDP